MARGNRIYLKVTAIENLTRLFDSDKGEGLETPGDAQIARLDYNLINPNVAYDHIKKMISSYCEYSGIPSISKLIDNDALIRLIWVSAGVPRDALYIFSNAFLKAKNARRKSIRVTDINLAATDLFIEKKKYIITDFSEQEDAIKNAIEDLKDFCLTNSKNAFLIKIASEEKKYLLLKRISDLRFIHIIHPGITPHKAGEKFEAYILDYGFYTGMRRAKAVEEFYVGLEPPPAKSFRKLSEYKYYNRLA